MKLTCTKENLYKSLLITSQIAGRNSTLPILNNILIKARDGVTMISATNLEVGVTTVLRGKINEDGAITVQGKLLNELVSLLPDEKIDLETEGVDLKINCGGHQSIVHGLSADDYPVIPEVANKNHLTIISQELIESLEQVMFAINPTETRPEIGGVLFLLSEGKLRLVSTDSYRLAEKIVTSVKGVEGDRQVIVPLRTLQQLVRVLSTNKGAEVDMQLSDNQVVWFVEETTVVSRVITTQFPDYKQIIPTKFSTSIWLDRQLFQQAIKEASLFSRTGINDVRLVLDSDKKVVIISSSSSQVGENAIVLPVTKITGEYNQIVFNYHYLIDGLSVIPGKELVLEIVDGNNPGLLKPTDGSDYIYIIMPIRQ